MFKRLFKFMNSETSEFCPGGYVTSFMFPGDGVQEYFIFRYDSYAAIIDFSGDPSSFRDQFASNFQRLKEDAKWLRDAVKIDLFYRHTEGHVNFSEDLNSIFNPRDHPEGFSPNYVSLSQGTVTDTYGRFRQVWQHPTLDRFGKPTTDPFSFFYCGEPSSTIRIFPYPQHPDGTNVWGIQFDISDGEGEKPCRALFTEGGNHCMSFWKVLDPVNILVHAGASVSPLELFKRVAFDVALISPGMFAWHDLYHINWPKLYARMVESGFIRSFSGGIFGSNHNKIRCQLTNAPADRIPGLSFYLSCKAELKSSFQRAINIHKLGFPDQREELVTRFENVDFLWRSHWSSLSDVDKNELVLKIMSKFQDFSFFDVVFTVVFSYFSDLDLARVVEYDVDFSYPTLISSVTSTCNYLGEAVRPDSDDGLRDAIYHSLEGDSTSLQNFFQSAVEHDFGGRNFLQVFDETADLDFSRAARVEISRLFETNGSHQKEIRDVVNDIFTFYGTTFIRQTVCQQISDQKVFSGFLLEELAQAIGRPAAGGLDMSFFQQFYSLCNFEFLQDPDREPSVFQSQYPCVDGSGLLSISHSYSPDSGRHTYQAQYQSAEE